MLKEKKCDDKNYLVTLMKANQIFQNGSILFQEFISNIFELHKPKTGGKAKLWYNFPNFPKLTNLGRDAQAAYEIAGAV